MSEEQKKLEAEEITSFVDAVLGGEDETSHSPGEQDKKTVETAPKGTDAHGDLPIPDGDDEDLFTPGDSTGEEQKEKNEETPSPDTSAMKQEIDTLRKRLRDTQSAMHRATGERSRLQKELDELKARQQDEDDWFSDTDKERVEKLEEDLKKSDEEISRFNSQGQEIAQKAAIAEWDEAAAPVIAKHSDFEDVVYEKLVPLLDKDAGNAQVREAFQALKDKSPASVYAFAKKSLDILDFQRDPEAYKANLRKQLADQYPDGGFNASPVGKEGLDMLPSADHPVEKTSERGISFVDAVFGP